MRPSLGRLRALLRYLRVGHRDVRRGRQDYALAGRGDLLSHIAMPRAPVSAYAGVLGMPGVTAWLALLDLAPPKVDDAVLVSTAAGAVGSVVGQIARQRGAHVIGLTGSNDKVACCVERYGYHAAFNYKTVDLAATLKDVRPQGFDKYFDNTGGMILDCAIRSMARYGRIIQCGTAATDSWVPPPTGMRNEREMLTRVLTWTGFYIFDHVARFGEAIDALTDLLCAGDLAHDEDIEAGLDRAPTAFMAIFNIQQRRQETDLRRRGLIGYASALRPASMPRSRDASPRSGCRRRRCLRL